MQCIEDLKSWLHKWSFNMMGTYFAQDEYLFVFEPEWNGDIFQELFLWLQEEGKRKEHQGIIAEHDRHLCLSTDMPQQQSGNMNCALHTSQGCDILPKGDSLESFKDNGKLHI
eukprot:2614471-Ditylum_brightwellii.AAC.1